MRTILLCDDNQINRRLVTAMLHGLPYRVIETHNGRDCLAAVFEKNEEIDLILMDINMTDISGVEVCKEIRTASSVRCQHLPIIAFTAHAMDDECRFFLANGFDDVLTKPTMRDDLLKMLDKHITEAG